MTWVSYYGESSLSPLALMEVISNSDYKHCKHTLILLWPSSSSSRPDTTRTSVLDCPTPLSKVFPMQRIDQHRFYSRHARPFHLPQPLKSLQSGPEALLERWGSPDWAAPESQTRYFRDEVASSQLSNVGSSSLKSLNRYISDKEVFEKQQKNYNIISVQPKEYQDTIKMFPKYRLENQDQNYFRKMQL